MKLLNCLMIGVASTMLFSCVSSKKYKAEQARALELTNAQAKLQGDLKACEDQTAEGARKRAQLESEIDNLNKQIAFLKDNNTNVLGQLKDLSVLSATQAESVKKSLENLGAKDAYIQDLQSAMARKDSLNMALVMNLKGALNDVNDKDVEIKVEKGVVFISISDRMLFKSGSYEVTDQAKAVLGKVAQVLNANPQISFLVEGHTDTVAFKNGPLVDNWDLSVKRATSVTRILQNTYKIDPTRMTAGGRGQYAPVVSNDSPEGRATNRRTRIVIQPQLDQFFQLLEKKPS
jgi:chemotaxis protein MotB